MISKKGINAQLITNFSPTSTYVLEEISLGKGDFNYKDLDEAHASSSQTTARCSSS